METVGLILICCVAILYTIVTLFAIGLMGVLWYKFFKAK